MDFFWFIFQLIFDILDYISEHNIEDKIVT